MGLVDVVQWITKASAYLGITTATALVVLLYVYQKTLISGSRTLVATPDEVGLPDYENLTITTPDNVKINAYLIKYRKTGPSSPAPPPLNAEGLRERSKGPKEAPLADTTIVFCHANAGNMGHRLPIARVFHARFKSNVLMFSYRGYGKSEGSPSEKGMKIDAQAALDWVLEHPQLRNTKIVVYGMSIGGAVAINLAATNQERVSALMIDNTFLTMRKLIPHVLPILKHFTFLCNQIWDSESAIKTISRMPILLLSGGKDELIPATQMVALCRVARRARSGSSPEPEGDTIETDRDGVRFVVFPNGTHNETCVQPGYFDAMLTFWESFVVGNGGAPGVKGGSQTVPSGTGNAGVKGAVKVVREGGAGARL
ncbi:hypothetical protein HKX48_000499 [Thoreauomyces humboldtii]|nr:hypothetical protein HKX48_000499 [Thoreauomyces humboldtii]